MTKPIFSGCLNPVTVKIPEGCLLDPSENAAVVGGNVLTSQRIVDVVLLAFEGKFVLDFRLFGVKGRIPFLRIFTYTDDWLF